MLETVNIKRLLLESFCIICLSAVTAFAVNLAHPRGYVLVSREELENKNIVHISVNEAKIKYDRRPSLFIDSRRPKEFSISHITGALNIPSSPESLSMKKINEYFTRIRELQELVIYCSNGSCGSADILAGKLLKLGYSRKIYVLEDGLPAWSAKNFPVETEKEEENTEK